MSIMNELLALMDEHVALQKIFVTCPYNIFKQFEVVHLDAEELLLHQDKMYQYVYILVSGEVKIFLTAYNGRKIIIDNYQRCGLFIGEQEALIHKPYSASAINATPVTLIKMSNDCLIKWLHTDTRFALLFVTDLCKQVHHLTRQTNRFSLFNAKEQIIQVMYELTQAQQPITKPHMDGYYGFTGRQVREIF